MSDERYTVIRTKDCMVIQGHLPLADCGALLKVWSEYQREGDEWILDPYLAEYLEANLVAGPKSACQLWRQQLGIAPEGPPGHERQAGQGNTQAGD
jgi:hypothetical protein